MIVETVVSTLDSDGRPNFGAMGVLWGEEQIVVRPFRNTQTYRNLAATGHAVVNVTDDVLAFVDSAFGEAALPHFPAVVVPGVILVGACYWRELTLVTAGGSAQRGEMVCRIVHRGWQRDFLGFNRARGAVIEAAILATRLHLLERDEVAAALDRFDTIVQKTGDAAEHTALRRIREHTRDWLNEDSR